MKVVLLMDVKGHGKKGDIVEASDGYARNILLPRKLATPATKDVLNAMKGQQDSAAYHKQQDLEEAQERVKKIDKAKVVLTAKCCESGKLFGSITNNDIAHELKMQQHIVIDKKKILLDEPIKNIGAIKVKIKLHSEVTAQLSVEITESK